MFYAPHLQSIVINRQLLKREGARQMHGTHSPPAPRSAEADNGVVALRLPYRLRFLILMVVVVLLVVVLVVPPSGSLALLALLSAAPSVLPLSVLSSVPLSVLSVLSVLLLSVLAAVL